MKWVLERALLNGGEMGGGGVKLREMGGGEPAGPRMAICRPGRELRWLYGSHDGCQILKTLLLLKKPHGPNPLDFWGLLDTERPSTKVVVLGVVRISVKR